MHALDEGLIDSDLIPISDQLPFDLKVHSVSNWLEELPIDAHQSWQLIYSSLRSLNKLSCEPHIRLNILQAFRRIVFLLSNKMQTHTAKCGFSLDKKGRKIAKLSVKLHVELASGYLKITSSDTFENNFSVLQQAEIIHRAMQSFSVSLLRTSQMFEPPSSTIWRKLNQLYTAAEAKELTDLLIDENQQPFGAHSSICSIFKRTVMFQFVNPCRFTPQDMLELFRFLDKRSDDVRISSDQENYRYPHAIHHNLENNGSTSEICQINPKYQNNRYFFTEKLIQTLIKIRETEAVEPGSTNYKLKIIPYFGKSSATGISGTRKRKKLIQGFNTIFSLLYTSKPLFNSLQDDMPIQQDYLKIPDLDLVPLANETGILDSKKPFKPPTENIKRSPSPKTETKSINCYSAHMEIDGFYLVETDSQLEIGEIIAFWAADEPVQIGAIQWENAENSKDHFQYGIELLGSHACAVIASFQPDQQLKILIVKNNTNGIDTPSILLPLGKYRSKTVFSTKKGNKTAEYQLERLCGLYDTVCQYSIMELTA